MRLEKTPSLRPFPGKFVIFAQVAGLATQYKVTDVIGWNIHSSDATYRESVLNVIVVSPFSLFKLVGAIVASVALTFQHFLDLLKGMGARNRFFECSSVAGTDSVTFLYLWTGIVGFPKSLFFCLYFRLASIGFATSLFSFLNLGITAIGMTIHSIFFSYLRPSIVIFSVSSVSLFDLWSAEIVFLASLLVFSYTRAVLVLFLVGSSPFLNFWARVVDFTCGFTACLRFWIAQAGFFLGIFARFASRFQPSLLPFIDVEVFRRGRKLVQTFGALLLRGIWKYSIAHGTPPMRIITPLGCLTIRRGKNVYNYTDYTIKSLQKQIQEVAV